MKTCTKLVAIVSFIFNTLFMQNAHAGRFYDEALSAVAIERININFYVQDMVMQDIFKTAQAIFADSAVVQNSFQKMSSLDAKLSQVILGFDSMMNLNADDMVSLKQKIQEELVNYSKNNRELFALTWAPSTALILQRNFLEQLKIFLESFEHQCRVGRNDINYKGLGAAVAPDRLAISVGFMFGEGEPGKAHGKQYNYSDKTLADITTYSAIGVSAAGSVMLNAAQTAAYLNGVGVQATTAAVSSTAMMAFAGFAAIMAVAMIANSIQGTRKYNKMMSDYYNGESYKIKSGPSSEEINQLYRENCGFVLETLKKMQPYVEGLLAGGEKKKQTLAAIQTASMEVNKKVVDSEKFKTTNYQIIGLNSYKEGLCLRKEQFDNTESDKCQIVLDANTNTKNLHCAQGKCRIEDPDSAQIDVLKKEQIESFEAIVNYQFERTMYNVLENIFVNPDSFLKEYSSDIFRKAFMARHRALERVLKVVQIYEKTVDDKMESEIESEVSYLKTRKAFLETLALTFDFIFGRVSKSSVLTAISELKKQINVLDLKYSHVEEVKSLINSFSELESFMSNK